MQQYRPVNYVYYDWSYPKCNYRPINGPVIEDARWFLGIKGMILPGKGLGIEKVEANSPADFAGVKSGMVIVSCNGIELANEEALGTAIAESNGILKMQLLGNEDDEAVFVTLKMARLLTISY